MTGPGLSDGTCRGQTQVCLLSTHTLLIPRGAPGTAGEQAGTGQAQPLVGLGSGRPEPRPRPSGVCSSEPLSDARAWWNLLGNQLWFLSRSQGGQPSTAPQDQVKAEFAEKGRDL